MLDFDIENAFNKIQHEILIEILQGNNKKYQVPYSWKMDKATEDLIWKMLKVGYVNIHNNLNDWFNYIFTDVSGVDMGVFQGSVLSPLFCNIYFHQFDIRLEALKKQFDAGKKRFIVTEPKKIMRYSGLSLEKSKKQIVFKTKNVVNNVEKKRVILSGKSSKKFDYLYKRLY
jgi:retron-type reverse transcriptase